MAGAALSRLFFFVFAIELFPLLLKKSVLGFDIISGTFSLFTVTISMWLVPRRVESNGDIDR